MKSHVEHTPKLKSPFQLIPSDLIVLFDSTVRLNESIAPRCSEPIAFSETVDGWFWCEECKRNIKGTEQDKIVNNGKQLCLGCYTLLCLRESGVFNESVAPRCRCGETEHLQSGVAAGNIIWYCPVCRADEEQR